MGKEEIALKLKRARIKSGKTQKEVADALGMTYQAISNYERGKTKVESDILIKLCDIYGISISSVLPDCKENNFNSDIQNDFYPKTDLILQKIIECYNKTDDTGRNSLLEQAEFIQSKHPRRKESNRVG